MKEAIRLYKRYLEAERTCRAACALAVKTQTEQDGELADIAIGNAHRAKEAVDKATEQYVKVQ